MPSIAALGGGTDFSQGRQTQPGETEKWPQIIFRCQRPDWASPRRSLVKRSVEAGSVHSTKTLFQDEPRVLLGSPSSQESRVKCVGIVGKGKDLF